MFVLIKDNLISLIVDNFNISQLTIPAHMETIYSQKEYVDISWNNVFLGNEEITYDPTLSIAGLSAIHCYADRTECIVYNNEYKLRRAVIPYRFTKDTYRCTSIGSDLGLVDNIVNDAVINDPDITHEHLLTLLVNTLFTTHKDTSKRVLYQYNLDDFYGNIGRHADDRIPPIRKVLRQPNTVNELSLDDIPMAV